MLRRLVLMLTVIVVAASANVVVVWTIALTVEPLEGKVDSREEIPVDGDYTTSVMAWDAFGSQCVAIIKPDMGHEVRRSGPKMTMEQHLDRVAEWYRPEVEEAVRSDRGTFRWLIARGWPFLSVSCEFWMNGRSPDALRGGYISPLGEQGIQGPPGPLTDQRRVPRVLPFRPTVFGFLANTLIYAGVVAVPLVFAQSVRRRFRQPHHRCPSCAYDLRGGPHVRCPECGRTLMHRSTADVSPASAQRT